MNALANSPIHGVLDDRNETLEIGDRGQWFRMTDFRVDISRRKPVARLLLALAKGATEHPGVAVSTKALIEAAWPGEFIVRHAAQIRLRVAIATLRASGLSTRIVTSRAGYMLDGPVALETNPESDAFAEREPSALIEVREVLESGVTELDSTEGTRASDAELELAMGLEPKA